MSKFIRRPNANKPIASFERRGGHCDYLSDKSIEKAKDANTAYKNAITIMVALENAKPRYSEETADTLLKYSFYQAALFVDRSTGLIHEVDFTQDPKIAACYEDFSERLIFEATVHNEDDSMQPPHFGIRGPLSENGHTILDLGFLLTDRALSVVNQTTQRCSEQ